MEKIHKNLIFYVKATSWICVKTKFSQVNMINSL